LSELPFPTLQPANSEIRWSVSMSTSHPFKRTQTVLATDKHVVRKCRVLIAASALAGGLALCTGAAAMDLITAEEAALPAAVGTTRGGITRGPSVKVVSPDQLDPVRAPFPLRIDFQAHGGSKIDASSVKVIYLRTPSVDLTPRLTSAISQSGIKLEDANTPAGIHDLQVDVADTEGRTTSRIVRLTVVK
jgi:hypothetical protein